MAYNAHTWQIKGRRWKGVAIYHVTVAAVKRDKQHGIFGELKWSIVNNQVENAHVEWSELGKRIRQCIQQIHERYPEINICAATIMPDHIHMVLHVTQPMKTTFNMVLRGWIQGCKKAASELEINEPIFAANPYIPHIRVMTFHGQLQTMCEYVKQNPFRMAIRLAFADQFAIQRHVEIAGQIYATVGNMHLVYNNNLWQVHVHKELVWQAEKGNDQQLRDYKNECVMQSRKGATLVSPFISKDESDIRDVALREHKPIIYIIDNGFPSQTSYKPAGYLTEALATGRLLILSPWTIYVEGRKRCTREECNAMNKMAEKIVQWSDYSMCHYAITG